MLVMVIALLSFANASIYQRFSILTSKACIRSIEHVCSINKGIAAVSAAVRGKFEIYFA